MDRGAGVRARGTGIQIDFPYRGIRCRETLKIPPTRANLAYAEKKRASILYEIERGTFDYLKHFPNSRQARRLFVDSFKKSVGDALDDFLAAAKNRVEYSTWRDYSSAVKFRKLPRQVDSCKLDCSAMIFSRYFAGGRLPSESCGRMWL